ncbi:hypothetical protein SAMN05660649_03495 [Desulfotomaculum arcticum]|uniref:Uncharacterized protein n=1 Tax=Desulfotruncus arcticus DSM 17038 TaxID=1121424 RepID=A0A1I2WGR1_9FIRM|nr:hypothetical protein SAMN05660649_03495 [Desulfotomaculum arcticum] [Desulfotruncus arcticus DSM 17038]
MRLREIFNSLLRNPRREAFFCGMVVYPKVLDSLLLIKLLCYYQKKWHIVRR